MRTHLKKHKSTINRKAEAQLLDRVNQEVAMYFFTSEDQNFSGIIHVVWMLMSHLITREMCELKWVGNVFNFLYLFFDNQKNSAISGSYELWGVSIRGQNLSFLSSEVFLGISIFKSLSFLSGQFYFQGFGRLNFFCKQYCVVSWQR